MRSAPRFVGFLSPGQRQIAAASARSAVGRFAFYGGYEDAERVFFAALPDWLEEDRLAPYFSSVVLSSVCHLRKPGAEIYRIALRELGVEPGECVSVADNIKRDITGAKGPSGAGLLSGYRP